MRSSVYIVSNKQTKKLPTYSSVDTKGKVYLYSEKYGGEKCHEESVEEESNFGCAWCLEFDNLYSQVVVNSKRKLRNHVDHW